MVVWWIEPKTSSILSCHSEENGSSKDELLCLSSVCIVMLHDVGLTLIPRSMFNNHQFREILAHDHIAVRS